MSHSAWESMVIPAYDFGTDCLAEAFMKNTTGGAIGVFASSRSSYIEGYEPIGTGIMEAIFHGGLHGSVMPCSRDG